MIVLDCVQGGSEWHKARLGIPTASNFERILTPKELKPSTQAKTYLYELLSEWLIGIPHGADSSGFMERGKALEPQARSWYAYEHDVDVRTVGIVLRDDRMVAASPDALVGEDGGLEIKCPGAAGHVRNLVEGMGGYVGQCQGAMWLTGRKWWDLISYHPDIPPVVYRHERDEVFIEALEKAMGAFVARLLSMRAELERKGCRPASRLMLPASAIVEDPF